jgi:hypothetical protein
MARGNAPHSLKHSAASLSIIAASNDFAVSLLQMDIINVMPRVLEAGIHSEIRL